MASSYTPLITRLYEVLVDGEGSTKPLAASERFAAVVWPDQPDDEKATAARGSANGKAVWVDITDAEPDDHLGDMAPTQGYRLTVSVEMYYATAAEGEHATAWRDALSTALLDKHRIRNALCRPPNLEQTKAGADTGVASALQWVGWSKTGPDPVSRLLSATAEFQGYVLLSA